jgi:hypothetical protein
MRAPARWPGPDQTRWRSRRPLSVCAVCVDGSSSSCEQCSCCSINLKRATTVETASSSSSHAAHNHQQLTCERLGGRVAAAAAGRRDGGSNSPGGGGRAVTAAGEVLPQLLWVGHVHGCSGGGRGRRSRRRRGLGCACRGSSKCRTVTAQCFACNSAQASHGSGATCSTHRCSVQCASRTRRTSGGGGVVAARGRAGCRGRGGARRGRRLRRGARRGRRLRQGARRGRRLRRGAGGCGHRGRGAGRRRAGRGAWGCLGAGRGRAGGRWAGRGRSGRACRGRAGRRQALHSVRGTVGQWAAAHNTTLLMCTGSSKLQHDHGARAARITTTQTSQGTKQQHRTHLLEAGSSDCLAECFGRAAPDGKRLGRCVGGIGWWARSAR